MWTLSSGHPACLSAGGSLENLGDGKKRDGTAGGKPERQAAFQSLLAETAKGEDEKTPCFSGIFSKKQSKTLNT